MDTKTHHTEQPDGSMLIDFTDRPLNLDGTDVRKLTMREPTVEDQIAARQHGDDSAEAEIAMFANLVELAPDQVRKLTMRQYVRLQEAYAAFLS
ncbi:phage tail assembly protein [Ruegeria sp. HKCCD8929]|uniref:phage tail assembly protein n=1 Tax=Ruegeria sp. HKCCD8929 TaxID=2683006 RepID=UPI001489B458|nr:phage tail assembly protein [Ruegeria sp. HKCCD8929]